LGFDLTAQDPYFTIINKGSGLPANSVYSIYQDSKGFIWMAHDNGLTRYDGTRFKSYATENMSSRSGSGIREDVLGRIWYENFDGYLFYIEKDTMHALKQEVPHGFLNFSVSDKLLCRLTTESVDFYDIQTLQRQSRRPTKSSFWTNTACAKDVFYFLGEKLVIFRPGQPFYEVDINLDKTAYNLMCATENGVAIAARSNKAKQFTVFENNNKIDFFLPENIQAQAICYTENCFWLATTAGVYAIDRSGKLLNQGKPYFKDFNITSVFKDKEGNYWFTTAGSGILLVNDLESKVVFSDLHITQISAGQNVLFVGTFKNQIYKLNSKNAEPELFYQGQTSHPIEMVEYLEDCRALFFVNDYFRRISEGGKEVSSIIGAVKDVCSIQPHTVGFAATGACGYLKLKQGADDFFQHLKGNLEFKVPPGSKYLAVNVRAKTVEFDPVHKRLCYGTGTGLFVVDTSGKTRSIFYQGKVIYPQHMIQTMDSVFVLDINGELFRMEEDRLIRSNLLGKLDEPIKNIKVFNDTVIAMTDHFLLWRNPHSKQVLEIPIQGMDVSDYSLFNGDICMVAAKGIRITPLQNIHPNSYVPKLHVIDLLVNGVNVNLNKLDQLSHLENNIEIQFALPGFSPMASRNVCYAINSGEWVSLGTDIKMLRLPAMAPGNYEVKLSVGYPGKLLDNPVIIQINISPPWYKSWWGMMLWIILLVTFVSAFYLIQAKLVKRKNKLANEKAELENEVRHSMLTAIKSQMNPHFFHNALNTIQSFIYSDDKKRASIYLTKFSRLSRMILEMSDKEVVSIREELVALELYLDIEKVRFNEELNYEIHVDHNLPVDQIVIPSMIIQPYVENALKHGLLHKKGKKMLAISIRIRDLNLEISIDDNGVGRKRAAAINLLRQAHHQSFATRANEKRLSLLNKSGQINVGVTYKDKEDLNQQSTGTLVVITLPLQFSSNA